MCAPGIIASRFYYKTNYFLLLTWNNFIKITRFCDMHSRFLIAFGHCDFFIKLHIHYTPCLQSAFLYSLTLTRTDKGLRLLCLRIRYNTKTLTLVLTLIILPPRELHFVCTAQRSPSTLPEKSGYIKLSDHCIESNRKKWLTFISVFFIRASMGYILIPGVGNIGFHIEEKWHSVFGSIKICTHLCLGIFWMLKQIFS